MVGWKKAAQQWERSANKWRENSENWRKIALEGQQDRLKLIETLGKVVPQERKDAIKWDETLQEVKYLVNLQLNQKDPEEDR